MAETENGKNIIEIEQEIEGDQTPTNNFSFSKIGEHISITSDADFKFDVNSLPSCPLAVSQRFDVIIVAHSSGFCVAKTNDVVEELNKGGNGSCIQELSVVDVSIGKVSVLALSADSFMLAASVGSKLYFFSLNGLLNKDNEPSFVKSLDDSSYIKDMQWSSHLEDQYVVLASDGKLYSGAGQDDLNNIMDNVDAVNWSMNEKSLAVASDGYLHILSSKFEEKLRVKLLFDSLVGDDPNCVVKVDSVRWVRPDCVMLGCYCLNADGKEENYVLQLLCVNDGKITNPSSSPVALTFSDAFIAVNDDTIPCGSGPYTSVSYLEEFELAFVANKKNTNEHIALFAWSPNMENGASKIEIETEAWFPTIPLQHNDDDNMILGLAINKIYKDETITLPCGEGDTRVPPYCILLCLTVDGKLIVFHFASVVGPTTLREDSNSVSDEEVESPLSSQHPVMNIAHHELQTQKVEVSEPSEKAISHIIGDTQQDAFVMKPNNNRDEGQSLPSQKHEDDFKTANKDVTIVKSIPDSLTKSASDTLNKSRFGTSSGSIVSSNVFGAQSSSSGSFSGGGLFSSNTFGFQSSSSGLMSSGGIFSSKGSQSSSSGSFSSGGLFSSKAFGVPSSSSSSGSFSSGGLFSSNSFGAPSSSSGSFSGAMLSSNTFGAQSSTSGSFSSRGIISANAFRTQSSGGTFSSRTSDVKSLQSPHSAVQGSSPATSVGTTSGPLKYSFPKLTSGSSAPSNLFPHGTSTGATVTKSLPVVSDTQTNLGNSSGLKFYDKGNLKNRIPSRLLDADPNLSEQHSVEEMAKELDTLLDSIVGPGGFYDASVAAHKPSVAALEEGILLLSDRCQKSTDTLHRGSEEVQLLLDKTVQVLARKVYMEAIVKQATDSQYLDIWNRQKLSSELDLKRRHILEINKNLTNQLIELERHLNTLELQKFGDNSDVKMNRRSFHLKQNPPRHVQSLHSLHNTMNAQLTAAEKLSECLSKQMAVLNIDSEPVKKTNVKKEILDTIGFSYDASSPGQDKTPKGKVVISSNSSSSHRHMKKSQQDKVNSFEPETARRRRDSLDKNWASIEPPKTTVKRILLQENHQMSPARLTSPLGTQKFNQRLSERSVISHGSSHGTSYMSQSRGSQDTQIKKHSEEQSSSSLNSNYRSDSTKNPLTSGHFLGSVSQSTAAVTSDTAKTSYDPNSEKPKNRLTFSIKSDPVLVNDPKPGQQSQSFPNLLSNNTKSVVTNKKPIEYSESSTKDTNQKSVVTESPSIWSKKFQESSFSAVPSTNSSSSTAFSGKSFSLEASTRENPSPIATSSPFSFKDTNPSSTSAISLGKSLTGFWNKVGPTQTAPLSSSATSFSKPTVNVDSSASKSDLSKLNPDTIETNVVSAPKFDFKSQTSPPQPDISASSGPTTQPSTGSFSVNNLNITPTTSPALVTSSEPNVVSAPKFDFKSQTPPSQPVVSFSSGPTTQPSTGSFSVNERNLTPTTSPALPVTSSKPEQLSVSPAVSSPSISNLTDRVGEQINGSDVAVTQEDEMEEETSDTTQLTLGNLGGFGLGSSPNPNPSAPKQNPFGAPFGNEPTNTPIASFTPSPTTGGLFRPASFNVESQQPSAPPQQTSFGAFSGGFASNNNNQSSGGQGFGQPARIGSGQQALGSVLGSFGQSRQFGSGLPGNVVSPSPFGSGFGGNQTAGGFATAASSGGGFANLASAGGGFGGLAAGGGGGGFAAAATGGGGFGGAATGAGFGAAPVIGGGFGVAPAVGGGFGGAAAAGGGFGGVSAAGGGFAGAAASGGFGGFSGQGGSGFSTFGNSGGTTRPPSELFTQMRK
ncbi:nuclear pore complex protein NUP214 [Rutidosis leptorrhynchoides]|uniref:nuclear pore complex protein NUP214 n=1 Tax=Rutidosis leptorrhynchoides TaxID=125765 RepID=UPI003A997920